MSKENLLPCPFCGNAEPVLEDARTIWIVRCKCEACILGERSPEPDGSEHESYWDRLRLTAIERWNTRAQASREVVAWRYMPSPTWGEYVITQDPKVAEVARSMGAEVEELTVGATPKMEDKT